MSVVVVATLTPQPEHRDAVREAILQAVAAVHDEPGCQRYALHEADGEFVMVEQWESTEALDTHSRGAALQTLGAALAGKLTGRPDVRRLSPVPAGDPAKGAL